MFTNFAWWRYLGTFGLSALLGCTGGTQDTPVERGDTASTLAHADAKTAKAGQQSTEGDVGGAGTASAGAGKVVAGPGGRKSIKLLTPQGHQVELPADHDPWADRVVSFTMGKPAAQICTVPETTVGKPDFRRKAEKKTCLSLGHGGVLVLEFVDNRLIDGPGDDLVIFEVGPAVEPMDVAISENGQDWIEIGQLKGAKCTIDIGPAVRAARGPRAVEGSQLFRFVRITDARAGLSNRSRSAGADLDAVGALNSVPAPAP